MKHIKLKTINLKNHPTLTEQWLQDAIADDPKILGIGDVVLKDRERIHTRAGRLDLLLQDSDGHGRYEVELQLGAADESHIIRTIEYWDIERRKYPQYDHTAVIVAEDITSRFLNVISLFNGFIPIIALQVTAIETGDGVGLQFTKVLDTVRLGYVDDDEEVSETTDRIYWESTKGTKKTVAMADKMLELVHALEPTAELNYNKYYIGLKLNSRPFNFVIFRPQKNAFRVEIQLLKTDEIDAMIEAAELDVLDYEKRWGRYRIKLSESDLKAKEATLIELLKQSHSNRK